MKHTPSPINFLDLEFSSGFSSHLLHLVPALILAIMVLLLDLRHIVELMLTGIMLAYTLATFSVLVLR